MIAKEVAPGVASRKRKSKPEVYGYALQGPEEKTLVKKEARSKPAKAVTILDLFRRYPLPICARIQSDLSKAFHILSASERVRPTCK
jgi:hypothetical protein